jgi:ADP-heptose:LPS heptosyltransferase
MNSEATLLINETSRRRSTNNWSSIRNLLCVRLDSMGDVIMTLPALYAIKVTYPHIRLTLLTSSIGKKVALVLGAFIDEVIAVELPWVSHSESGRSESIVHKNNLSCSSVESVISLLSGKNFDASLIFTVTTQNSAPTAMLTMLSGIPLRGGYCREEVFSLFTNRLGEKSNSLYIHEVTRHLHLVESIFGLTIPLAEILSLYRKYLKQEEKLTLSSKLSSPYIVVHPGSSAPSRQYPTHSFFKIIEDLISDNIYVIVPIGPNDKMFDTTSLLQLLSREKEHLLILLHQPSLDDLCKVINGASIFIGNNSGPMHIASLLNIPTLCIYAQTNPQHTPWSDSNHTFSKNVSCKNCFLVNCAIEGHPCLTSIEPNRVSEKARSMFRSPNVGKKVVPIATLAQSIS